MNIVKIENSFPSAGEYPTGVLEDKDQRDPTSQLKIKEEPLEISDFGTKEKTNIPCSSTACEQKPPHLISGRRPSSIHFACPKTETKRLSFSHPKILILMLMF